MFVPDELVLPKGEDFRSVASQVLRPSRLIVGNLHLIHSMVSYRTFYRLLGRYDETSKGQKSNGKATYEASARAGENNAISSLDLVYNAPS